MKNTFKEIIILVLMTVVIVTGLKFSAITYVSYHPEIAEMQVTDHHAPRPRMVYTTVSAKTVKVKKPLDN